MPSTSIRIDLQAMAILRSLARKRSLPLQTVLSEAIDCYRRQQFLAAANAAFEALRSNPGAWHDEREERELWDRAGEEILEPE
jgi:hypothetical protein